MVFIDTTYYWLIGVLGIVALGLGLFYGLRLHRKKQSIIDVRPLVIALGGLDNIRSIRSLGSRVTVEFVSGEKIRRDILKNFGVHQLTIMSGKAILLVGASALEVASQIEAMLTR